MRSWRFRAIGPAIDRGNLAKKTSRFFELATSQERFEKKCSSRRCLISLNQGKIRDGVAISLRREQSNAGHQCHLGNIAFVTLAEIARLSMLLFNLQNQVRGFVCPLVGYKCLGKMKSRTTRWDTQSRGQAPSESKSIHQCIRIFRAPQNPCLVEQIQQLLCAFIVGWIKTNFVPRLLQSRGKDCRGKLVVHEPLKASRGVQQYDAWYR